MPVFVLNCFVSILHQDIVSPTDLLPKGLHVEMDRYVECSVVYSFLLLLLSSSSSPFLELYFIPNCSDSILLLLRLFLSLSPPLSPLKVCRNGKCTAELENIIPDYTHVTQTVVSRSQPDRLLSRSDNSFATSVAPLLPPPAALQDPETIVVHDLTLNPNPNSRGGRGMRGRSFRDESDEEDDLPSSHPALNSPPASTSSHRKKSSCRDIIEKMAGSLSCSDFLERFGYRYCNHSYVKRNCCASHAIICNKTAK